MITFSLTSETSEIAKPILKKRNNEKYCYTKQGFPKYCMTKPNNFQQSLS